MANGTNNKQFQISRQISNYLDRVWFPIFFHLYARVSFAFASTSSPFFLVICYKLHEKHDKFYKIHENHESFVKTVCLSTHALLTVSSQVFHWIQLLWMLLKSTHSACEQQCIGSDFVAQIPTMQVVECGLSSWLERFCKVIHRIIIEWRRTFTF